MTKLLCALCLGFAALGAVSCCSADRRAELPAVHGNVVDVGEFDRFVATKPKPEEFRAHYPDVVLVLPGDITTKELRRDRSRYFAELDAEGRIRGGSFK